MHRYGDQTAPRWAPPPVQPLGGAGKAGEPTDEQTEARRSAKRSPQPGEPGWFRTISRSRYFWKYANWNTPKTDVRFFLLLLLLLLEKKVW